MVGPHKTGNVLQRDDPDRGSHRPAKNLGGVAEVLHPRRLLPRPIRRMGSDISHPKGSVERPTTDGGYDGRPANKNLKERRQEPHSHAKAQDPSWKGADSKAIRKGGKLYEVEQQTNPMSGRSLKSGCVGRGRQRVRKTVRRGGLGCFPPSEDQEPTTMGAAEAASIGQPRACCGSKLESSARE